MSLAINVDDVKYVLLADGVWYQVLPGTFGLDGYEFTYAGEPEPSGEQTVGFEFKDADHRTFSGPLTSILAVQR